MPDETNDPVNPFREALFAAWLEMEELKRQEKHVAIRKAQIQQTINALYPLVYPDSEQLPDVNALSLPNAIRLVIHASSGRPMSAADVRAKLSELGYDLDKFDNALTNIHTAMSRLVDTDEMVWVKEDGKKKALAGPELKPVPEPAPDLDAINAAIEAMQKELEKGKEAQEGSS